MEKPPNCLEKYLTDLPENVLIAWDAPLTATHSTTPGTELIRSDLTQRILDAFFSKSKLGWKPPKGISVLPYSGCSHWTISRRMLGLPRVGGYDCPNEALPFQLITENLRPRPRIGRHVVEVHPALALWLWCREERKGKSWLYKSKTKEGEEIRNELWDLLSSKFESIPPGTFQFTHGLIPSDDELDAIVAFVLARSWCSGGDSVMVLGNDKCGAMLLPNVPGLRDAFEAFEPKELNRRAKETRARRPRASAS
jgi:hypothetical protein